MTAPEARSYPESEPEELLALATAIVQRSLLETRESNLALAAVGLEQQPISSEAVTMIQVGSTAAMLKWLGNPEAPISLLEVTAEVMDDVLLDKLIEPSGEVPDDEMRQSLRSIMMAQINSLTTTFGLEDTATQKLGVELGAAKAVARRHQVPLATVYQEDELYYETQREIYTPESYARGSVENLRRIDHQFIENICREFIRADLASDPEMTDAEREAELQEALPEIMKDISLDDAAREAIEIKLAQAQQAVKIQVVNAMDRIWGIEAELELSAELQQTLAIQRDYRTADLGSTNEEVRRSALLRQRRMDFIKVACQANGWDFASLTTVQLTQIYASEVWKNLTTED